MKLIRKGVIMANIIEEFGAHAEAGNRGFEGAQVNSTEMTAEKLNQRELMRLRADAFVKSAQAHENFADMAGYVTALATENKDAEFLSAEQAAEFADLFGVDGHEGIGGMVISDLAKAFLNGNAAITAHEEAHMGTQGMATAMNLGDTPDGELSHGARAKLTLI